MRISSVEAQKSNTFISQGKQAKYKDGTSRYDKRKEVSTNGAGSGWVEQDVNMLFKTGNYLFSIPVHGKTDDYDVVIEIKDFLPSLNKALETKQFAVPTFQSVLMNAMNNGDMKVSCSCPDFRYRWSHALTLGDDNSGRPESRPSPITNPTNQKSGCKHILYTLSNKLWATKVARTLFNYIIDIWKNKKQLFDRIIRPALNDITDEKILSKPPKKAEQVTNQQPQEPPANQSADGDTTNSAKEQLSFDYDELLHNLMARRGELAEEAINSYYQGKQQFDEDQEFALSICKEIGADVRIYVTPENTPEQIEELGQMLKSGVTPKVIQELSDPLLSYRAIQIIGKASLMNIDLLPYKNFAPDALEQILRGVQLKVPLDKIALRGFNSRQIEQLVRAYRISPKLYEKVCDKSINYNRMRDIIAGRS